MRGRWVTFINYVEQTTNVCVCVPGQGDGVGKFCYVVYNIIPRKFVHVESKERGEKRRGRGPGKWRREGGVRDKR